MSMSDAVKQTLSAIPRFAQDFVNLLIAPLASSSGERVFNPTKFREALVFLAVSLLITLLLKTPVIGRNAEAVSYLAADAIWKFFVVLIVSCAICIAWRLFGVNKPLGAYLVAGFFFFGVFSVLSHAILLINFWLASPLSTINLAPADRKAVFIFLCLALLVWMLVAWYAYIEYSGCTSGKGMAALIVAMLISAPALGLGFILREAILSQFAPAMKYQHALLTQAEVMPNPSFNRTHCGVPPFAPPFHSGSNAITPQRAG